MTVLSLLAASGTLSKKPKWNRLNEAPLPRHDFSSVLIEGKIYIMGGNSAAGNAASGNQLRRVDVYDIDSDSWSTIDSPVDIGIGSSASASADGEFIYVHGGVVGVNVNSLHKLRLSDGTLSLVSTTAVGEPRNSGASVILSRELNLIGGNGSGGVFDSCIKYNTATDLFTDGAGYKVRYITAVSNGNVAYILGGRTNNSPETYTKDLVQVSRAGRGHVVISTEPREQARYRHGMALHDGKLYIIGGISTDGVTSSILEGDDFFRTYEFANGEWKNIPIVGDAMNPRYHPFMYTYKGKIYMGMGYRNGSPMNDIYSFDPS